MSNTNPRDQHNAANALSNEQGGEFATTSIHRTSDEDTSVQSTPDQVNPSPIKPLENKSLEAHVTHPSSDQSSPIQEPEVTIAYGHNTPTILDPQQQSVFATDIYIDSHKRSEESLGRTKKELAKDFGDYELLGEIARGGMGVVYRARQKGLNRIVALKMILAGNLASEIDIKRFYTEAEAAAKLDHPGIVPIYEVNQKDDQHYFAMGFIDGPSLSAKIREQTFTPRQSAEIAIAIADAVEYAHQQGIIHRDLKPQNILLTSNGQPKVTDFGLAKHLGNESDLTSSGQILGTPNYMAPEQASGNTEDIGPQADVYALGGILYCMLVGKPPFQGKNLADTLQQVQFTEATPPSKLNPKVHRDLETICMKALSKTPSLRYQTAAQFADDLRRFCDGEPILGRREGWYSFLIRRAKRNTVASAAIAIVGAVVLLASLLVWRSSDAYQLASLNQRLQVELDSMELSDEKLKSMDAIAASIAKIAPDNFQYTSKRINDKLVATLYQKINQPRLDPSNLQQIETWIDIVGQRSESSVAGLQDAYQARIRTWETVLELKPPFTDSPKAFPTLSRSDHNDSLFASSLIPTFHLSTIPGKGDTVFEAEFEPNDTHQIIGLVLSTSPGHRQLISSAAFLKNNTELLTGAANIIHGHPGELILWEVHTGKTLKTFALPVSGTPLIRILADSNTVILAMKDQSRIWKMDLEKGIWNEWFTYPDGAIITSLELASKSNILALTVYHTDASRSVDTWKLSVPNPSIPENRTLCKSYVELLKINPTGEEILWYSDKTIHLQNFVSNAAPLEIACDNLKNVNDELSVALVQMDGYLELWNMKTDKKVPLPKKEASYCTDSSFSPDGELVAITSDFRENVFRVSNGKSVNEFSNSDLNLQDITCRSQFSLNSAYLLLATKDGSFFIRDRKLHKLLPRYGFSGYSFLLKFPEYLEGQARPEKGLLQILRNRSILRSEEVRLPGDQLHITARRENDLLSIQLNDLPPIEFREIFPLSNNESTVIGVVTSATDKITSIRARKRTQSANLSKLESADMVYGSGDFEQARQLYSTYTLDNFDLATVQESLFKQALCLIELDRAAEADELLSNLVTQNGDHWPPMAACQLWLRRIRQNKSAEADELLDFLTSRFRFEELVGMIPEEAREEIIALYRDVAVSSKLFLPNPSRIQQAERSLAVQKLFFGFGGEMHMIRALHIAGRLEEATEYAEQFVQTGNKQAMKAENLVGCIQEYIWLLQLQGKAREALEAINRIETESFSHGTWLPDNAWAPDKVRLLYAMGKSAEAIAMARNEISAINASLSSPLPKSKLVYARANTTLLQTMAAMLLEEQGDTESAKKFWLNQPEENWELNDLNIETIHNHILASRGKTMTVEQSQRFLNRILRSMGDMGKMMEATGIMATVAPGFAELFESKRGKQVAFDFVFRTHPLSNYIRSYPQLVAYETVRRSILLPESPEYHDQIIWETCKDGCDLYMDGKLSSGVVVPLALSWKGTNGFLGWGAASPTLPKDFRARAAFVLGVRYERLGRAKDAITFFQQASRDGTDVTGLPEAAQKEIERLQTLVQ